MTYTLIFSGPARTAGQAQNALARAGFPMLEGDAGSDPHGLPATVDGSTPSEPQAFIAVRGDDVDAANSMAGNYGWALRACRPVAEPNPAPSVALPSADMVAKLNELESRVAVLEAAGAAALEAR